MWKRTDSLRLSSDLPWHRCVHPPTHTHTTCTHMIITLKCLRTLDTEAHWFFPGWWKHGCAGMTAPTDCMGEWYRILHFLPDLALHLLRPWSFWFVSCTEAWWSHCICVLWLRRLNPEPSVHILPLSCPSTKRAVLSALFSCWYSLSVKPERNMGTTDLYPPRKWICWGPTVRPVCYAVLGRTVAFNLWSLELPLGDQWRTEL